jgi:hypothetical protein
MLRVCPVVRITTGLVLIASFMAHPECTNAPPPSIRIVLGEAASSALTASGEEVFVVIGKATTDAPGRWAVHLLPCPMKQARDAIAVATGEARAVKPRAPKQ